MPLTHVDYLFSLEQIGIKLGLEQIRALVAALNGPDTAYPSIVVAGTNGKGSVTAMVERGLRAAGHRTGRYTSPHLVRLEERFAIDGVPLSAEVLESLAGRVRRAAAVLPAPPSFFEATTALALEAFRDAGVSVAVLEVGLGGRLDATNVVNAAAVAITAIDLDHQQFLGETIEQIAAEKAGVIKAGCVAVLGSNAPVVVDVVRQKCRTAGARFVSAPDGVSSVATLIEGRPTIRLSTPRTDYGEIRLGLRGRHQVDNAVVAARLLEEITVDGVLAVPADAIRSGLTDVVWPGRLETLSGPGGPVLIDGAHNPAGARALASYVRDTYHRRLPFVIGVMRDKQVREIVAALAPAASHLVFTAPATARAAAPEDLASLARDLAPGSEVRTAATPRDAVALAQTFGAPVVVAGSLYLAGDIREWLA